MITLMALSDTHQKHDQIKADGDADFLVHCGDFCGYGTKEECEKFIKWFGSRPARYKICVAGNHDAWVAKNPIEFSQMALDHGVIYLQDQLMEIEGVSFYGFPWSKTFGLWHFMLDDLSPSMEKRVSLIPDGVDVLICHGPPHGARDMNLSGKMCGSLSLRRGVIKKKPKILLTGHIHESNGIDNLGETLVVNCAVLNARYQAAYSARFLAIETKEDDVASNSEDEEST